MTRWTTPYQARIDLTPILGVILPLIAVFMTTVPPPQPVIPLLTSWGDYRYTGEDKMLIVSVTGRDEIYIGTVRTDLAALDGQMATAMQRTGQKSRVIMVRADRNASYDDFMRAADTLQRAGYHVALINEDIE